MRSSIIAYSVALTILAFPPRASAVDLTLKLEPGVAFAVADPQLHRFSVGGAGWIKGSIGFASLIDLQIGAGYLGLPGRDGGDGGSAISAGGGVRIKRPHRSAGSFFPWIDGDALYVRTGTLDRFGFAAAVGLSFPAGAARAVWLGPFVRYFQVVQPNRAGYDNTDSKILIAGLGLEAGTSYRLAPPDRDQDGIPDAADACPDEPGLPSSDPQKNGCPGPKDRDHDGVLDPDDLCPNEPMGLRPDPERRGCPAKDSDGDGLFDYEDKCPLEPMGAHPDKTRPGCPDRDSDGDGILDGDDKCPNLPGPKETGGCPDRDHDGVADEFDHCPDVPGPIANNGCPSYKSVKVTAEKIEILQKVFFAFDKTKILTKSFGVLDEVVQALKDHTALRVRIEGHTDSKGSVRHNDVLSSGRARAVLDYLVAHGVAADRLESQGFGSTVPRDTNATATGRENNRRVEFTILSDGSGK